MATFKVTFMGEIEYHSGKFWAEAVNGPTFIPHLRVHLLFPYSRIKSEECFNCIHFMLFVPIYRIFNGLESPHDGYSF